MLNLGQMRESRYGVKCSHLLCTYRAHIIRIGTSIAFNLALSITLKKVHSEDPAGRFNFKVITTNLACLMAMVLFLNQFSPLMYDSVRHLGLTVVSVQINQPLVDLTEL